MSAEDAIPDDDATIADDVTLYRRVPIAHQYYDKNRSCHRCSTGLFRDSKLSIGLGNELEKLGKEPQAMLDDFPDNWLVSFPAGVARSDAGGNQHIRHEPTAREPWHGVVYGKKREAIQKFLACACSWVVPPPEHACPEPYPPAPAAKSP
jgi:hypothetical protein